MRERLLDKIEIVSESGCWIWMGVVTPKGYGHISVGGKKNFCHRLSYSEFVGEIPKGLCVCHKCDVPACINPDHLFLGTHKENMDDRTRKGRSKGFLHKNRGGEGNPNSKLKAADVIDIRKSTLKQRELSEKYNVSMSTISGIKTGRKWRHV